MTRERVRGDDQGVVEERCRHDMIVGQCADCALPGGLPRAVYRTKGGRVFHRTIRCPALRHGQRSAASVGQEIHPPELCSTTDLVAEGYGACESCFPGYDQSAGRSASKPCEVDVDGRWVPGRLIRWQRGHDRRWEGVVTFTMNGERVTVVKDQDDLRPAASDAPSG